jgi:23S rRNA (adenine2030-N6)-methyltransferase
MNYRHAFHAGNFADVFKHALLARILTHLAAKDTPFRYMDTHAGIGIYNLAWDEATRTREADGGIRLLQAKPPEGAVGALFAPYLAAVASVRSEGREMVPGSPAVATALLRPQDKLTLAELHPEDARQLRRRFARDRRVTMHEMDGWQAVKAWLPPPERRGVVLIDPPFEQPGEFERMETALVDARRRWPTGTMALWYPVKDWRETERFARALVALAIPKTLRLDISIDADAPAGTLSGTGLIVVNPPWMLKDEAGAMLPWLARTLAAGRRHSARAEWLVGE